jgi:hypothetical protein
MKPYHGSLWRYWLGGGMGRRPADGEVEVSVATSNYAEDEGFARFLIRKRRNLKKLPKGTQLYPTAWTR